MAKLDRPLYGDYATSTLARALAFRHTLDPPTAPGDPPVTLGTVAKLPFNSCPPSPSQIVQRSRYSAALTAWRTLSPAERAAWGSAKPANLTGLNFFIRLYFFPSYMFFGYCIFGPAYFSLADAPDQPAASDYDTLFPSAADELPVLRDGADSPQAWLYNRGCSALLSVQSSLTANRISIETR